MNYVPFIVVVLLMLLSGCVSSNNEQKIFNVSYDCISCKTRNTTITFNLSFGEGVEFNRVSIEVLYENNRFIERYSCYPSEDEIKNASIIYGGNMEDFWKQKLIKSNSFECLYYSKKLKKPGNYTFKIYVYKVEENGGGTNWVGFSNVSIEESGSPPEDLKGIKLYKLGELIKEKPLENRFIYKVEYKDSIQVWKCEKPIYEVYQSCLQDCRNKGELNVEGRVNLEMLMLNKCYRECVLEDLNNNCEITTINSNKDKKFAIIHYGIGFNISSIDENNRVECPTVTNDNIVASLASAGICAIPLTIETSKVLLERTIEAYQELYPVVQFLTGLMFGFIGGTSYEIRGMDYWDVTYRQYLPKTVNENNKTYYLYYYSESGFFPYVYEISKEEELRYLVVNKVTSGFFLLIPVKKENIVLAVDLKE